ncbi:MAG: hypothetical protein JWQ48_3637 [Conexibacter sp.]|jgi:hypothetical protein|nr:hypothetical protein [Conexibacter sp.]
MTDSQLHDGTAPLQIGSSEERLAELPMAALLRLLSDQTSTLVREEIALAKAELSQKGRRAGAGAGLFGGAGLLAVFGVGALTAAAVLALDLLVASWLAALIVAVLSLAIAAVAGLLGRTQVQRATPPMPEQTVATLKADVQVARSRVQEARR